MVAVYSMAAALLKVLLICNICQIILHVYGSYMESLSKFPGIHVSKLLQDFGVSGAAPGKGCITQRRHGYDCQKYSHCVGTQPPSVKGLGYGRCCSLTGQLLSWMYTYLNDNAL